MCARALCGVACVATSFRSYVFYVGLGSRFFMLVFQWSLTRRLQPPHAGISCPGRGAVLTAVPLLVRLWTRASATARLEDRGRGMGEKL